MKTTQYLNLIAITIVFQNDEHSSSMTNFAFFPLNNSVDFVQKEKRFFDKCLKKQNFPKANEMRKFFLCLLCNGQPNDKKTF